nr:MAG TPA: hypothetical protein [Caudoviricetes sp.]
MRLFKIDNPEDRTPGEIFAAHCASYVIGIEHDLGSRSISIGDSAGAPIGLYTPAQLTGIGGAKQVSGARFMCDLADLIHCIESAADKGVLYDACRSVCDLTLERHIK